MTAIDEQQWLPLCYQISQEYERRFGLHKGERLGEAFMALRRAIEGFDESRGVKFMTYVHRAISRAVWMPDAQRARNKVASKTETTGEWDEMPYSMRGLRLSSGESVPIASPDSQCWFGQLSPQQRDVLYFHVRGMTNKGIGEVMGLDRDRVCRIFMDARSMIEFGVCYSTARKRAAKMRRAA